MGRKGDRFSIIGFRSPLTLRGIAGDELVFKINKRAGVNSMSDLLHQVEIEVDVV